MFSQRHADTDEALDFCKRFNLLLALDSETPQDQLRAACRIAGSSLLTWKEEVALCIKHEDFRRQQQQRIRENRGFSSRSSSSEDAVMVESLDTISFVQKSMNEFRFGQEPTSDEQSTTDDNDSGSSSASQSLKKRKKAAAIAKGENGENEDDGVFRSPNWFFTVGFLRFRRLAHSRFRLRDIIRKYVLRRRAFIEEALDQWRERELSARVNLDFSEYVLVYVPPELRRQVIGDYHCACAHQCILFLRATKTSQTERMSLRKSFFIWAYHQRKVSSTTFRIAVVALFIFKERARKRAWVRKLLSRSSSLSFGKNTRVAALLMSGCTCPTRWCKSLLSLQSLAWCSAIRKHALKMITAAKPILVYKKEDKNKQEQEAEQIKPEVDQQKQQDHDVQDQEQDEFAKRSSSLLATINKNHEDAKLLRSRSSSTSSADSVSSTLSAELNIQLSAEKLAICFAPWVNGEITTTWFSIHLQKYAREIAKVVERDQATMKKKVEDEMAALQSALAGKSKKNNKNKNKTLQFASQANDLLLADGSALDWSQFLISPAIFNPFSFVDIAATAGDTPADRIRQMLVARADDVDRAMMEGSRNKQRQVYSMMLGGNSANKNQNKQQQQQPVFAHTAANEYIFRGKRADFEVSGRKSPNQEMVSVLVKNEQDNDGDDAPSLSASITRGNFNIDVGHDGILVSTASAARKRKDEKSSAVHATFLTDKELEDKNSEQQTKETSSVAANKKSSPSPSSRRKSLLASNSDSHISPYSQTSFRRKSLADGSHNFSFSHMSSKRRNNSKSAQNSSSAAAATASVKSGKKDDVDIDDADSSFRQAVNSLLRSSSALHLKSSSSFHMQSSYTDIAVGRTAELQRLLQIQNSEFVGDSYYDHHRFKDEGRFISEDEMELLGRVLAKQSRAPTLWGKSWQTDPHWHGIVSNVGTTWVPVDFSSDLGFSSTKQVTDRASAYRKVLQICIAVGSLRITDPYRWKQAEKLNRMMMQEEFFKKLREKRYFKAKRERKKLRDAGVFTLPGCRETVLSVSEAERSMMRKRRNSEIIENSCELFGELSTLKPKDVLNVVSKKNIAQKVAAEESMKKNSRRSSLQPKTAHFSASVLFAPTKPTVENTAINNNNNNNGNRPRSALSSTMRNRSTPRPLKHIGFNKNSSLKATNPNNYQQEHKLVVVDENVIREEEASSARNRKAIMMMNVAPPKNKQQDSTTSEKVVKKKFGSSFQRAHSFSVPKLIVDHQQERESQDNDENTSGDVVENYPHYPVDVATELVAVSRSELHRRQDRQKDWTREDALEKNEPPQPFGFNCGFPAIFRCIAGKEGARSLPVDEKHFK